MQLKKPKNMNTKEKILIADFATLNNLSPKFVEDIQVEDSIQMVGRCHCSCK